MPAKFASITFDCCKTGDMICQTAGSIIPHLAYPRSADEQAAIKFAVEKIKGGKGVSASAGGAASGKVTFLSNFPSLSSLLTFLSGVFQLFNFNSFIPPSLQEEQGVS